MIQGGGLVVHSCHTHGPIYSVCFTPKRQLHPDMTNIESNSDIAVPCQRLSGIANGQVQFSSDNLQQGTTATYTCQGGYNLNGNSVRTCQSNGQWSGQEPRCDRAQGKPVSILKY